MEKKDLTKSSFSHSYTGWSDVHIGPTNSTLSVVTYKRKITEGRLTVAVMGRAATGKSSIFHRYMRHVYVDRYAATVGESYNTAVVVDGCHVQLELLDTPGGYCFEYGRRRAILDADAFVLVYSVDEILSFQRAFDLRRAIMEARTSDVPIVVVQTKADLERDAWFPDCHRLCDAIPAAWGHQLFQVSAKDGSDMSVIFEEIVRESMKTGGKVPKLQRTSAASVIDSILAAEQVSSNTSCDDF